MGNVIAFTSNIAAAGFFSLERLKQSLSSAAIIMLLLPALGFIVGRIMDLLSKYFSLFLGKELIYFIRKYATFPGVMHHEISHALFAFLLGAKVTKIELFTPDKQEYAGCVEFQPRGPKILQQFQICVASAAPVFLGLVSLYFLGAKAFSFFENEWVKVLVVYLMISIAMHLELSKVDVKNIFENALYPTITAFLLAYIFNF